MQDQSLRDKIRLKTKNDYGIELTENDISLCEFEMETRKVSIFHGQIYPNKRSRKVYDPKSKDYKKEFFIRWELTIDGARAIAHRHGLCGIDKPVFVEEGGVPISAKITVYKRGPRGERYPFVGFARYDEFVQTYFDDNLKKHVPNSMWKNSPYNQLAKCAESQALRKGFQELAEEDPFLVLEEGPVPKTSENEAMSALNELTEISQELGMYEGPDDTESVAMLSPGEKFGDQKIVEVKPIDGGQKLLLEDGIKVNVFDNGKIDFENAFSIEKKDESPKQKTVEDYREFALPLLKRWCEEKNGGKKVSYKEAYKELLGVVVSGDMTINDYENLTEQLQQELSK